MSDPQPLSLEELAAIRADLEQASPLDRECEELRAIAGLLATVEALHGQVEELTVPPADLPEWAKERGIRPEHYREARSIRGRIFGPYQWQNQEDRAACMTVAIVCALDEATKAAEAEVAELEAALATAEQGHATAWNALMRHVQKDNGCEATAAPCREIDKCGCSVEVRAALQGQAQRGEG